MPSFTYTALALGLVSLVSVSAAPVAVEQRGKPSGWATGYLESYDVYHTRYLALSCQTQHNTTFFDDCCHPLLATENLVSNRKAYCTPSATATSSAAAVVATQSAVVAAEESGESGDEYCEESSSIAAVVASVTATATAEVTAIVVTASSSTATINVQNDVQYETTQAAPTSTYEAPAAAATTTAAASTSSDDKTGGSATYFYQNGNAGACGTVHGDYDNIVAIDSSGYWGDYASNSNSQYCGKWLTITNTNNGKSVVAMVADVCPTCNSGNSLDLSVGAFTSIASTDDGMVPISWHWN